MRGCGCSGHPAFPAPLLGWRPRPDFRWRETFRHHPGISCRGIAEVCLDVIASVAKQSALASFLLHGIFAFARNDGWVAKANRSHEPAMEGSTTNHPASIIQGSMLRIVPELRIVYGLPFDVLIFYGAREFARCEPDNLWISKVWAEARGLWRAV